MPKIYIWATEKHHIEQTFASEKLFIGCDIGMV